MRSTTLPGTPFCTAAGTRTPVLSVLSFLALLAAPAGLLGLLVALGLLGLVGLLEPVGLEAGAPGAAAADAAAGTTLDSPRASALTTARA